MSLTNDEYFMALAIKEAKKGIGRTSPNPNVGAVVVLDGKIVSKGYHKKAGTPHAEIHALRRARRHTEGATIYVTLEPCSHTGRTPPCCKAIVNSGIKKVVVGMVDPNPLVSGTGNQYLQSHGVAVIAGVLEDRCISINRPFIKHITTSTPWVVMKAGISLDGRISYQKGVAGRITGGAVLRKVHRLRDTMDAILVGCATVIADDPSLTTRIAGRKGHDPVRVVLDTRLTLPESAKIFHLDSEAPTWIFCGPDVDEKKISSLCDLGVVVYQVTTDDDAHVDLRDVLKVLGEKNVTSLLVEGGGGVHGSFLKKKLVDHANLFYAPLFAGDNGVSVVEGLNVQGRSEAIHLVDVNYRRFGQDMMIEGDVEYF